MTRLMSEFTVSQGLRSQQVTPTKPVEASVEEQPEVLMINHQNIAQLKAQKTITLDDAEFGKY